VFLYPLTIMLEFHPLSIQIRFLSQFKMAWPHVSHYPPRILEKNITGLKLQPLDTIILTTGFFSSLRLNLYSYAVSKVRPPSLKIKPNCFSYSHWPNTIPRKKEKLKANCKVVPSAEALIALEISTARQFLSRSESLSRIISTRLTLFAVSRPAHFASARRQTTSSLFPFFSTT